MVRVKFTDKKGKTWTASFPKATMRDVRGSAKRINKNIVKIEYYRPKRRSSSMFNFNF